MQGTLRKWVTEWSSGSCASLSPRSIYSHALNSVSVFVSARLAPGGQERDVGDSSLAQLLTGVLCSEEPAQAATRERDAAAWRLRVYNPTGSCGRTVARVLACCPESRRGMEGR